MEKKKVGFASGVGFILAAAGSAVGLGNLWGFPYKTSQNGGAAFVLIYIACVLLIGFVTMLSEIYLGRRAQANPMTAYKMIHKNLGWCGLVAIVNREKTREELQAEIEDGTKNENPAV